MPRAGTEPRDLRPVTREPVTPRLVTRTITLSGREITYTVRHSSRAKSIRLRIAPRVGLEIVVPRRERLPDIAALLRRHAAWILTTLDRYPTVTATNGFRPPMGDGATAPYRGASYRLVVRVAPGRRATVIPDDAARRLLVTLVDAADTSAILKGWFKTRARHVLDERITVFAAALGVTYGRFVVRDQRTRWGSCSSSGNLNFNWRLILAPPAVLDYVVIHELAHRKELNHSARFWAVVAAHCPDYRARQRWLREHGAELLSLFE